ncbi:hypothetical protein SYJ56_22975 [Algoriphagus sp. D3-2-R+10]|uniref:glycosyltransferase n=1 Tax=Algoriphagus aurantiacus TaxID=3103948 RepID=UPI002B3B8C88|nr:hypothetical protein [Algoriphagus sp. D3-2-R+10]MEB2778192.1 hypothetical protein [Algoriphagus sp. D3-2-R+10]
MKIVLLGYIVRGPFGGAVWHHFQYALGLKLLGHEVLFIEYSEDYPSCYNPITFEVSTDPSYGLKFIDAIFSNYGMNRQWAYFDYHTSRWFGNPKQKILNFLSDADVLINIAGVNPLREEVQNIPIKIFIDTDPVFTQIRLIKDPISNAMAKEHNVFFSFGENIGNKDCQIPKDQFTWVPTRQPVIPELWKNEKVLTKGNWTTLMNWDSHKNAEWDGKIFGMKSTSFQPYFDLPRIINERFELALGSKSAPRDELRARGWIITNPEVASKTPEAFQKYISESKGEWSVAKDGFVSSNSGWFSERSAAYLMSGKPVVVQDTGFSKNIETGQGLFSFTDPEDLKSIFIEVNRDYSFHSMRAREIALEYFHYEKVLKNLLKNC